MSDDPCRKVQFPGSVVLVLFTCLFFLLGRSLLPGEGVPVFSAIPEKNQTIWIELGKGFAEPGFRQFIDKTPLENVIKLTLAKSLPEERLPAIIEGSLLQDGERLEVDYNNQNMAVLRRGWMSAAARITLDIPLHPDRMSLSDWPALPGIGPKLAARIEAYRQNNGDYGTLQALQKVSGIGPKRIKAWEPFFFKW